MLNPAANRDHYGLHGPDRDPAIVAPGYTGGLQGRVGAVYLAGAAVSQTDARIVLPSENPAAGVTVRYGAAIGGGTSETTAEPHLTDPLGPGDVLEFVLTLTVERIRRTLRQTAPTQNHQSFRPCRSRNRPCNGRRRTGGGHL